MIRFENYCSIFLDDELSYEVVARSAEKEELGVPDRTKFAIVNVENRTVYMTCDVFGVFRSENEEVLHVDEWFSYRKVCIGDRIHTRRFNHFPTLRCNLKLLDRHARIVEYDRSTCSQRTAIAIGAYFEYDRLHQQ